MGTTLLYDVESTGLDLKRDKLLEFGYCVIDNDSLEIIESGGSLVTEWKNPRDIDIPYESYKVHNISGQMIRDGAKPWTAYSKLVFSKMSKATYHCGHNLIKFDDPFIRQCMIRVGLTAPERPIIDTMLVARRYLRLKRNGLAKVAEHYGVNNTQAHRAEYDARANAEILILMAKEIGVTLDDLANQEFCDTIGPSYSGGDPLRAFIK